MPRTVLKISVAQKLIAYVPALGLLFVNAHLAFGYLIAVNLAFIFLEYDSKKPA
ncbi:hypothetical protein [Hymenobacter nivis]|uniref:hypothetical protein n=1 Tax=Hymenobacter nivis TaxID=1850093 RepID=UPI0013A55363|nr:hypothetical protein [Hymenobacter nivis]